MLIAAGFGLLAQSREATGGSFFGNPVTGDSVIAFTLGASR